MRSATISAILIALAFFLVGCSSPSRPTLEAGSGQPSGVGGVIAATPYADSEQAAPAPLLVSVDPRSVALADQPAAPEELAAVPSTQAAPTTEPAPPTIVVDSGSGAAALPDAGENPSVEPLAATPPAPAPAAPQAQSRAVNPEAGPVGTPLVIFDTDLGPDIDDALALAMLHGYQKRGAAEIAAVTLSRDSVVGARYADALNTFYGRPDIPIGILKGSGPYFSDTSNFVALANSYSHDIRDDQIEDGYRLLRRVLVEGIETGRPVIIIQVGFSGNLSRLVDSQGDDISPKSGADLIREAVSVTSIMGGSIDRNMVEFNIEKDLGPAKNLFAKWPGRIVLSPFELGYSIHYPYNSIRSDLNWTDRHPIKASYEFRDLDWHQDAGQFYNMRTWDLTAVMEAIEPNSGYFLISQPGRISLDGSGKTSFSQGVSSQGGGRHYVLDRASQYSSQQRQRALNRMIELVSERP